MRLVIASFICLAIICIGIYFKVYAVSAQQTTVTSGVVNQGADSSIALKKEYQVTSYKKNIATNARVVFADNSPLLIYAVTIPKSDDGSKNENMYGAFDKPKQNLAYLQINNISKEPLVAVPTINWGSTGHGDFSICNKDNTSGYLIGSDFNSIAGTLASAYLNRWYMWQYKDDKLVVSKLQEWKFPWGYLPPGIIMHNGKIIIAAESLDRAGEVCSTVINDPKKNYALKPISKERGEYPILAKKGDTVVLTFARFEGYYRDVTRAKLFMTTSKDGLTWTSPRSIINSTGIIQANQVIDENGNIFILFSTISHELRASVPANYNYSCGLQATRITTLWLTWSNDNGASFQEPVKVTEGINADHYPEIAIIEKHLRLFWTRYTSTKPDDPYSGIIAGNIITSNYGLTSEIIK